MNASKIRSASEPQVDFALSLLGRRFHSETIVEGMRPYLVASLVEQDVTTEAEASEAFDEELGGSVEMWIRELTRFGASNLIDSLKR